MTDLRKAAEQALEVLEQIQGGCTDSDDGTVEAITVWCPEVIEDLRAALAAEQAPDAVSAERDRWETAIGAVMPPDFKDWRENSPSERPAVAAWVISNLREREDALSRLLERHNALALNAAKLQAEVEALRRDAERLDSKRILVHSRDEFGEPVSVLHTGIDLRAAIDAARAQKGE